MLESITAVFFSENTTLEERRSRWSPDISWFYDQFSSIVKGKKMKNTIKKDAYYFSSRTVSFKCQNGRRHDINLCICLLNFLVFHFSPHSSKVLGNLILQTDAMIISSMFLKFTRPRPCCRWLTGGRAPWLANSF